METVTASMARPAPNKKLLIINFITLLTFDF